VIPSIKFNIRRRAASGVSEVHTGVPLCCIVLPMFNISLFRNDAPSVVLVLTKDGLGSGSLLNNDTILINRHVVGNERQVTRYS
jgi:hypothetical protein